MTYNNNVGKDGFCLSNLMTCLFILYTYVLIVSMALSDENVCSHNNFA